MLSLVVFSKLGVILESQNAASCFGRRVRVCRREVIMRLGSEKTDLCEWWAVMLNSLVAGLADVTVKLLD